MNAGSFDTAEEYRAALRAEIQKLRSQTETQLDTRSGRRSTVSVNASVRECFSLEYELARTFLIGPHPTTEQRAENLSYQAGLLRDKRDAVTKRLVEEALSRLENSRKSKD